MDTYLLSLADFIITRGLAHHPSSDILIIACNDPGAELINHVCHYLATMLLFYHRQDRSAPLIQTRTHHH